ncbi:TetR/AcrR family transcriptional regulator [Streptomyces sp. NPDC059215]|uniref:TetR/AcrR family transcriptional regulator n=1 Tax=Streptomyces sp. NPDC059215 TaxID=3346772 RepID=UPI0036AA5C6B
MVTEGLRERSKARRREAITRAAYTLFAEHGYSATSIADIADAAEVSPRTVTLYFRSKQDIAFAHFGDSVGRLTDALKTRTAGTTTLDILGRWLREESSHHSDLDDLQRRMFQANPELQALRATRLADTIREGAVAVAGDTGLTPEAPGPRITAAAAMAIMTVLHDTHPEADRDETISVALSFLGAGIDTLHSSPKPATP